MVPRTEAVRPETRRYRPSGMTFGPALAVLVVLMATPLLATTVRHLDLGQIVGASDTIVLGRVEQIRSFWQGKQIVTEVTVKVARSLKGARSDRVTFLQLGGRVESPAPLVMTVPGAPIHTVGDEAYFFLQPGRSGDRIIVGLFQGRVPVRRDDRGEYVMAGGSRALPSQFEEEIHRQIAGQGQGAGAYR